VRVDISTFSHSDAFVSLQSKRIFSRSDVVAEEVSEKVESDCLENESTEVEVVWQCQVH